MPTWNVLSPAHSASVLSTTWLRALGEALPHFNLPAAPLDRFVCVVRSDGSVDVHEPDADVHLRVVPMFPTRTPLSELPRAPQWLGESERVVPNGRPVPDGWIDHMALVGECRGRIALAKNDAEACDIALTLMGDLVAANAGAVLLRTPDGETLRFAAAFGPRAEHVLDATVPIAEGIVGFIHTVRSGVIIVDVHRDIRFQGTVDRTSGYETRSVLGVPIQAVQGQMYGCLELLNSPNGFTPRDLDQAQTVASALGAWMHNAHCPAVVARLKPQESDRLLVVRHGAVPVLGNGPSSATG